MKFYSANETKRRFWGRMAVLAVVLTAVAILTRGCI